MESPKVQQAILPFGLFTVWGTENSDGIQQRFSQRRSLLIKCWLLKPKLPPEVSPGQHYLHFALLPKEYWAGSGVHESDGQLTSCQTTQRKWAPADACVRASWALILQ